MSGRGGVSAGAIFVTLGGVFQKKGFDDFDHRVVKAVKIKDIAVDLRAKPELKGFDIYERKLKETRERAQRKKDFQAQLGGEFDNRAFQAYEREMRKAERDTVQANGRMRTSFGSVWGKGAAAFVAAGGVYGVVTAVKAVTKAYGESEVSQRKMAAQLKAVDLSYDAHAQSIDRVIQKTSLLSGLDDEDLQDSFTAIVRATGSVTKGLDGVRIAADLSRAKNIDVAKAGEVVAKVYNGQVGALKRLGISIDPITAAQDKLKASTKHATDQQIDAAKAADKQATAQKAIAALQQRVSGQAKAYGETQKGASDRAAVAFENLQEVLGQKLAPTMTKVFNGVANFINQLSTGTGAVGRFKRSVSEWVDAHRADIASVIAAFRSFGSTVGRIFDRMLPGIKQALDGTAQYVRGLVKVVSGILTLDFGKAWDGVQDVFKGGIKGTLGQLKAFGAPTAEVIGAIGKSIKSKFAGIWSDVVDTAEGFVNKIIDVINIIPGVDIGHVGGSSGGGVKLKNRSPSSGKAGGDPAGRFAEGGKVTMPIAVMGEEAPTHPEWVIPTNPAYRDRAVGLWMETARDLGIPGFKTGGLLDPGKALGFVEGLPGKAVNSAKGLVSKLVPDLPKNPGGILSGAFTYALDKAKDFITDKAGSVWDAAKNLVGGGPGANGSGTTKGTLSIANRLAKMFGLRITSTYRSPSHNAAVGGVPGSLHTHGSTANPGAVDLAGPNLAGARAWAASHLNLKELLVHDVGSGLHLHLGFFRRGGLFTGGAALPGGVMAYKKGGRTKAKKPPRPTLSSDENRGIKRSVARGERGISTYETRIQGAERTYGQLDRRFGLSDEEFLIENEDGSTTVDGEAVKHRLGELDKLTAQRKHIKQLIVSYRKRLRSLIDAIKKAIKRLERALDAATGKARQKERGGYRQKISDHNDRLKELRGVYGDLGYDLEDQRIDLSELDKEKKAVGGTTGTAAELAGTPDVPSEGPSDSDSTPAVAATPDADAVIAQIQAGADRIAANLAASNQVIAAFSSSGDIGTGGSNAINAVGNEAHPVGAQWAPTDSRRATAATPAPAPIIHQHFNMPGAPHVLRAIGDAATAGQGMQASIPSNVAKVGF